MKNRLARLPGVRWVLTLGMLIRVPRRFVRTILTVDRALRRLASAFDRLTVAIITQRIPEVQIIDEPNASITEEQHRIILETLERQRGLMKESEEVMRHLLEEMDGDEMRTWTAPETGVYELKSASLSGPCDYCNGTGTSPATGDQCKMCSGTGRTFVFLTPPLHPMCRCEPAPLDEFTVEPLTLEGWMHIHAKQLGWDGKIVEDEK